MLRVSKMLFLCAVSARVGLAVRQNMKLNQSGQFATVMEKIGALLQANDNTGAHSKALDNIRMLAANTPGHTEALNTVLTEVIAEIKANVDKKIMDGFVATQAAVNEAIGELEVATRSALDKKANADQADETWFQCIEAEKSKRVAFETAVGVEKNANASISMPCAKQENSKMFDASPKAGEFSCDFSNGDSCNTGLESYNESMNDLVKHVEKEVQTARETWNNFKTQCDAARDHFKSMKARREEADKVWLAEKENCQKRHEDRQLSLCSFGSDLQTKCEKVGAFSQLIEEVDAVNGGPNSEPDRQAEWKTTQITKCMLQKVIDGIDLDGDSLASCEDDVDYIESVGQFKRMQSEFETQTSNTSFTCKEQTISFKSGMTWNLPTGVAPTSSEYTTEPFVPQVNLAVGTPPFAFCSTAAPPPQDPVEQVLFTDSFEGAQLTASSAVMCPAHDPAGCILDAWINPSHPNYVSIVRSVDSSDWSTPFGNQAMRVYGYQKCPNKQPCGAETGPDVLTEQVTAGSTYVLTFNVAAGKEHGDYQVELSAVDEHGSKNYRVWTKTMLAKTSGTASNKDFSHVDTVTYTATDASPVGQRLAIRLLDADSHHWSETPMFDNIKLTVTRPR